MPVTVKLRAGQHRGDLSYLDLARRLADVGVAVEVRRGGVMEKECMYSHT